MTIARVNDIDLYYETFGDPSNPPLLIIPGLGDPVEKCGWQSAELAQDFHVIVPDNRGSGRSTQPPPGYTTADMGADAAALLDLLGIQQAGVFGFSLGGMVALNLALDRPDLVSRLALGCTSAGGSLAIGPADHVMMAMVSPRRSDDRRADYLAGLWISCSPEFAADNPDIVDDLADISTTSLQSDVGYAGQMQAVLTHDVSDRLGELDMPVLVLHGDADVLIQVENGLALAKAIPGAQFIGYPGAGHLFFIEQAGAVNDDLRRFFLVGETINAS